MRESFREKEPITSEFEKMGAGLVGMTAGTGVFVLIEKNRNEEFAQRTAENSSSNAVDAAVSTVEQFEGFSGLAVAGTFLGIAVYAGIKRGIQKIRA